jgi:DNA repair exonuclease SbcCD ATPase subunit
MRKDQDKLEQIHSEKKAEAKRLRNEVDNLEYELLLLEGKERNLKDHIITEKDFEALKNTEKSLQTELEELCSEDFDTDIDKTIQDVKRLEDCAKNLESLNFNVLHVTTVEHLKQQHTLHQGEQKKLTDEVKSLNTRIVAKTKQVEQWKELLDMAQTMNTELTNKLALEMERQEEQIKSKSAECASKLEEHHRLKTEIKELKEEIAKIEEDERRLNDTIAEEYQKILQADQQTTETFYNMLVNLKKHQ